MRSKTADEYIAKMSAIKTPYFKTIDDIVLRIDEGVYPTGKLGQLFHKAIKLLTDGKTKKILDYGTGSGFLSIAAAKNGANVVAIDNNPTAIKCAQYNAKQNKVSSLIDFRISDSLSAIDEKERFDIILAGMPWEEAIPNTLLESAFYDPDFVMRKALADRGKKLFKQNGVILLSSSQRIQALEPIEHFFPGYQKSILLEEMINDELHYIVQLN